MLVRTSLFTSLPKPWFRDFNTLDERIASGEVMEGDESRGALTDDIYFCRKATDAGHRILAHGNVICRHWGRNGDYYEIPTNSEPYQRAMALSQFDSRIHSALAIDGWMTPNELLWLAERASEHTEIVEIGSWKGRSARVIGENTKGRLTCIDTWAASSPELGVEFAKGAILAGHDPDWVYDEFRFNMIGLDNVGALRMSSWDAAGHASRNNVRFDMAFIDGAHDYESVSEDIAAWRALLKPGSLICGHDYAPEWSGVTKAVDELVPERKLLEGETIWYAYV